MLDHHPHMGKLLLPQMPHHLRPAPNGSCKEHVRSSNAAKSALTAPTSSKSVLHIQGVYKCKTERKAKVVFPNIFVSLLFP